MRSWKPELFSRPALVMIDMQNAFFETPALEQQRRQVTEQCNMLLKEARKHDLLIVNVCTIHQRDKSTWTLSMLEDDQGFLFEGTEQAQHLNELDLSRAVDVIKHRDSAFWQTGLDGLLHFHRIRSLILAGVASDSCMAATAEVAFAANYRVAVAKQAVASEDPNFEKTTLLQMETLHRQPAVNTESLIKAMS
ncbi:cysteine hydrolase [Arthrobacter sp. MYb213]|uniref:cysteine hydrolase family protein n=1 Tax=Arthrobacter sp. MYb213 TaxID=1848595 RepID=UPI000CFC7D0D|nr:cysteine hydrolase [Arthrobacter sp. MYb213]PRB72660.1 cysteine hydrolase [Arthrobacter sp. MYb213]